LIGVENLWRAVTGDCFLHGLNAEVRSQRVRQAPGQNPAALPIDDGDQIHETPADRNVGDVGGPYGVRPINAQVAQQIGIQFSPWPKNCRIYSAACVLFLVIK
jgi:hypothetical protein